MHSLRVAINATLQQNSGAGGLESVLVGLLNALGKLDGPEEYVVIGPQENSHWLQPYLGPNQRIVPLQKPEEPEVPQMGVVETLKRLLGPLRPQFRKVWRALIPDTRNQVASVWPEVPISDGFYEGLGCDVIHFPFQSFVLCAIPTVYNPHDLQHRHYPQNFAPAELAYRETMLPTGCRLSQVTVVASQWVKHDVANQYGISTEKIQVIPWAAPTQAERVPTQALIDEVQSVYQLKRPFAFYPAMIWPHKNHEGLLQAIAHLRDSRGIKVDLVCSGQQHAAFWPKIETCVRELSLENQVRFLGLVPNYHLRAIYRLAQFVIVPTFFEAASAPVFEAWQEDTPVACSAVTSLPEQVAGAGLLFDPFSIESIADALYKMSTDTGYREDLILKGRSRLQDFSWERTAKAYRAVYRRLANRHLSEEDEFLLNWDWMRDSELKGGNLP